MAVTSTSPLPWLARVAVADLEQGALHEHRQVERRAGDQLLVVHVAADESGRGGVIAADVGRRRDTHAAEEGMQRHLYARREMRDHTLAIEGDDLHPRVGEILAEDAQAVTKAVVGVRDRQIDAVDMDFQRVAGFGAVDIDGTGQDVAAGPAVSDLVVEQTQAGLDICGFDAAAFERGGARCQDGVEHHRVAGLDVQRRYVFGVVVAPGYRLRRSVQRIGLQAPRRSWIGRRKPPARRGRNQRQRRSDAICRRGTCSAWPSSSSPARKP